MSSMVKIGCIIMLAVGIDLLFGPVIGLMNISDSLGVSL